ncbi:MAG: LemA family protein, partial [Acidipropionibacterium jensenii]|nr:LemA family protein [Acidipropionibacterium jensenii]
TAGYFLVDSRAVRTAPNVSFGEISQRPAQSQPGGQGQIGQGDQTPAPGYQVQQPDSAAAPEIQQPATEANPFPKNQQGGLFGN